MSTKHVQNLAVKEYRPMLMEICKNPGTLARKVLLIAPDCKIAGYN